MIEIMAFLLLAGVPSRPDLDVRKVYVVGNNEAAAAVRRKLRAAADRYGEDACVSVVSKAEFADSTLSVNQTETSGGLNAIAVLSPGPVSTTVVSAELDSKDGSVLWQGSKQGMTGIVSTGAASGAGRVLESLYKTLGCGKNGNR